MSLLATSDDCITWKRAPGAPFLGDIDFEIFLKNGAAEMWRRGTAPAEYYEELSRIEAQPNPIDVLLPHVEAEAKRLGVEVDRESFEKARAAIDELACATGMPGCSIRIPHGHACAIAGRVGVLEPKQ